MAYDQGEVVAMKLISLTSGRDAEEVMREFAMLSPEMTRHCMSYLAGYFVGANQRRRELYGKQK